MATTQSVKLNKSWQKVSEGDCVVQSLFNTDDVKLYVGDAPKDDSPFVLVKINEPLNLTFGSPVWLSMPDLANDNEQTIVVIA